MPGLSSLATRPSLRRELHGGDRSQGIERRRAALRRGVRYGHVAMVPTSAKMKRRPKVYLTTETPVVACRFRVKSGGLSLRVYPDQRTFLEPVGVSQTCQEAACAAIATNFPHGLGR